MTTRRSSARPPRVLGIWAAIVGLVLLVVVHPAEAREAAVAGALGTSPPTSALRADVWRGLPPRAGGRAQHFAAQSVSQNGIDGLRCAAKCEHAAEHGGECLAFPRWGASLSSPDYVFAYDAVGRNTLLTYPGGFQRTQAFDHQGRLTERCYTLVTTRCYRATYDPVGNPLTLQDPEDTDTVTYDALDRLSTIQRGSATQTYAYNALGALHQNDQTILDDQRPKLAGGGNASSAVPATYNSTPVTLDGGGRITLLDGVNLKYSRRGALIGATKVVGPTTQGEWYGHDPDGRRIARVVSSTTANVTTFPDEEYFAWTGGNVVARLEKTGAVRQGFLFEGIDKPLRLRDAASNLKYYYELTSRGT